MFARTAGAPIRSSRRCRDRGVADFISTVTDAVATEISALPARPLERVYPVIFFDALRLKIRDRGKVRNKAVYLALGVLRRHALRKSINAGTLSQ